MRKEKKGTPSSMVTYVASVIEVSHTPLSNGRGIKRSCRRRHVSNGRGIKKGTQGSLLAWRAASLLLVRLLFVLKPHMRDDGRLQSEPKLQSEPMGA